MIKRQREGSELSVAKTAKRTKRIDQKLWADIESGAVQSTTAQFFAMLDALDLDIFLSVKKRTDLV